jgi:hypothetical protein
MGRCTATGASVDEVPSDRSGSDAVFELVGGEPSPLLHAKPAEECDVGRGAAKPDSANASPLADDGTERHGLAERLGHGLDNRMARAMANNKSVNPWLRRAGERR